MKGTKKNTYAPVFMIISIQLTKCSLPLYKSMLTFFSIVSNSSVKVSVKEEKWKITTSCINEWNGDNDDEDDDDDNNGTEEDENEKNGTNWVKRKRLKNWIIQVSLMNR